LRDKFVGFWLVDKLVFCGDEGLGEREFDVEIRVSGFEEGVDGFVFFGDLRGEILRFSSFGGRHRGGNGFF